MRYNGVMVHVGSSPITPNFHGLVFGRIGSKADSGNFRITRVQFSPNPKVCGESLGFT